MSHGATRGLPFASTTVFPPIDYWNTADGSRRAPEPDTNTGNQLEGAHQIPVVAG